MANRSLSHHRTCGSASGGSVRITHGLYHACVGFSNASCRERLDAPIKSYRLHMLRLFDSPSVKGFLSSSLIPRTAHCTHPLTVRPFPKKLLVLWPLLTSATSACPLKQGYFPARWQTSPGKHADFPCTPALFNVLALGRIGLRCYLPTRPASQPHRVRVPQVAGLLPASSRPRLATTPLPSANG